MGETVDEFSFGVWANGEKGEEMVGKQKSVWLWLKSEDCYEHMFSQRDVLRQNK